MRLFVAIDVSEAFRERVAGEIAAIRVMAPDAKWVAPGLYHLTLVFLGSVRDTQLEPVCAAVDAVAARHSPLRLEATTLGVFGGRRPGVLWLGLDGDVEPLRALHGELHRALVALGHAIEDRPYSPHLTLARARSPRGDPSLLRCAEHAVAPLGGFEVREIVVQESLTGPAGPKYTPRRRSPLRSEGP